MTSPLDAGAWIRMDQDRFGGFPGADAREGSSTGFGLFSTDPSSGGVLDTRGAFNPAFNGRTEHPVFEAETDAFRSVLPGLARSARRGDANAAAHYQLVYRTLDSKKRLYDLAYSTGLNDRNAVDVMNHVFDSVTPEKFGGGTDQYRTIYARYLASQAQQRGTRVRDLLASEQTLDDSFRTSFLPALSAATGVNRASHLKDLYGASEGMMANAGLFLKRGIADWEAKNGLRDDATRSAIMARAAEYYAKCLSNPNLRALAGDAYSMVDAAAGEMGAVGGVRKTNKFSDYTRAVNALDRGFISYTGTPDGDRAAGYGAGTGDEGDGRTAAFWAVRDAYEKAYARNLVRNGEARNFNGDYDQLKADLKANLREVSPRAAALAGWKTMIDGFVDEMVEDGEKGGIDLNKLSKRYFKDVKLPEPEKVPEAFGFRDQVQALADEMVTWGIQERPAFRRGYTGGVGGDISFGGPTGPRGQVVLKDQYDPAKIRARVADQIRLLTSAPGMEKLIENKEFLTSLEDTITGYIANANNTADPRVAGAGNVEEYRQGMRDRVNLLYMAEELRRRGVDLNGWSPNVAGADEQVRGNTEANLRGMYAQLSERIGDALSRNFVKRDEKGNPVVDAEGRAIPLAPGSDTDGLYGTDLHNWHFLSSMKKGLDFLMKSHGDADPDTPEGRRVEQYRRLFDAWAGSDMSAARRRADGAVALRRSESLRKLLEPRKEVAPEAEALAALAEDMFSDTLNPAFSDRAKRYADRMLAGADYMHLSPDAKKNLRSLYSPGVMSLMRQIMRAHPEVAPMAWSEDDVLFKYLDQAAAPLFAQAKAMSDRIGAAKQAELLSTKRIAYADALGIRQKFEDQK